MPHYLALGVDYNLFWDSNPYEMSAYDKAYKLKRQIQDARDWSMGMYIMSAVGTVASNMLDKHSTAKYMEKPLYSDTTLLSNDPEANERLAVAEMEKYIAELTFQGDLPQTVVNL